MELTYGRPRPRHEPGLEAVLRAPRRVRFWSKHRQRQADLSAIAEAETAARRVKQAFDALAENRLDISYVQAIVEQLGKIVNVAEDLEALSGKKDKEP